MATTLAQTDSTPCNTFTCFPDLPLELRRMIFKEACCIPRIYTFEVEDLHAWMPLSSIGNLPILDVSSESRASALEVLIPTWSIVKSGKGPRETRIGKLWMSSSDTVFFKSTWKDEPPACASLALLEGPERLHIARIAFEMNALETCTSNAFALLHFLIWTCPKMEFVLIDRQPARRLSDPEYDEDIQNTTIEEEKSGGSTQVSGEATVPELQEDYDSASLQLFDLEKDSCAPFDSRELSVIAELTERPHNSNAARVFPFHMPVTRKEDFQMPVFRRAKFKAVNLAVGVTQAMAWGYRIITDTVNYAGCQSPASTSSRRVISTGRIKRQYLHGCDDKEMELTSIVNTRPTDVLVSCSTIRLPPSQIRPPSRFRAYNAWKILEESAD